MNDLERLNLQKMIQADDAENNTHLIRNLKHSKLILADVDELLKLKKQNPRLAKSNPDVFDKVKKDEIDLNILVRLLNVLHSIEEGQVDQHEGSFEVGKLLKQIYIDSALKKADKLDEKYSDKKGERKKPEEKISWKQFKEKNNK